MVVERASALFLGSRPYGLKDQVVGLVTWKDMPVNVWFDVSEALVIHFERTGHLGNRFGDRAYLVEQLERLVARHQERLARVALCQQHAVTAIELGVAQNYV